MHRDAEGKYLRSRANIVAYPDFECGLVKILKMEECTLTNKEAAAVKGLVIEYNQAEIETDEENEEFDQMILKKPRSENESNYLSCKFVLPTSNLLERFFSTAGFASNEMRQSLSPCHLEEQLFLKVNNKFWNETLVNTIVNSKNE